MVADSVNEEAGSGGKPLAGRVAVVTGATRSFGNAIASDMRAAGAQVIGTGRETDGKVPGGCAYRAVNLDDDAGTSAFAAEIACLGPDILVNNAGMHRLAGRANTFISGRNIAIDGGCTWI